MATSDLIRDFGADKIGALTPAAWNALMRTIEVRLKAVEHAKVSFEDVTKQLQAIGLARINDVLLPAYQEIVGLTQLGALFTAVSETTVLVGTGQRQFAVAAASRDRFAPAAYLCVRSVGTPGTAMLGSLNSYDRATGTLTIDVEYIAGDGSHRDWIISASPAPNLGHEARTDNPHQTNAAQVGAYTVQAVDALLASRDAAIGAVKAEAAQLKGRQTLTGGFAAVTYPASANGGTFTPNPLNGNIQVVVNKSAHTLAAPASDCSMALLYWNETASSVAMSGFLKVTGANFNAAQGRLHFIYVTRVDGLTHAHIVAA